MADLMGNVAPILLPALVLVLWSMIMLGWMASRLQCWWNDSQDAFTSIIFDKQTNSRKAKRLKELGRVHNFLSNTRHSYNDNWQLTLCHHTELMGNEQSCR